MSGSSRTLLQVSAVIGTLVVLVTGWVMTQRRVEHRSEEDLIRELRQTSEGAEPALLEGVRFEDGVEDRELAERFMQTGRVLRGPLTDCVERWPGAPATAQLWVTTDAAGRLTGLAVKGAPDEAASCLLAVLKRGQFPRSVDGVAPLPLSPG